MTSARPISDTVPEAALRMPSRGMAEQARTLEDLAFSSGAALACLDVAPQAVAYARCLDQVVSYALLARQKLTLFF